MRASLPVPDAAVSIWIGDDCASIAAGGGRFLLLTTDSVVAGVHADLALTTVEDLGWKAVAAAVSDVAAMGGEPGHLLVAVTGPPSTDLDALYRGIGAAAQRFGFPVVGGDLANGPGLVVTVSVTGWCDGAPVARSGARPGDEVWVTGPLGASAAGLRLLRAAGRGPGGKEAQPGAGDRSDAISRHARPVALLAAGRAARAAGASAMIDVSDGLSADLDHLARASGVGLRLDAVPVHPAATRDEALEGGEDYQLAFCAPSAGAVLESFAALDTPIRIGRCTSDPEERLLEGEVMEVGGWQHEWRWP